MNYPVFVKPARSGSSFGSYLGSYGTRGVGYDVQVLERPLRCIACGERALQPPG
ncbi:hypothetical protein [Amycolatopsis coloradensis]|uniref:hypothetical protein n=1 Tax=Amycolatopsis coloradensis TaxID=76021 RepID=UPI003CC918AC